jgi:hypothetical protein
MGLRKEASKVEAPILKEMDRLKKLQPSTGIRGVIESRLLPIRKGAANILKPIEKQFREAVGLSKPKKSASGVKSTAEKSSLKEARLRRAKELDEAVEPFSDPSQRAARLKTLKLPQMDTDILKSFIGKTLGKKEPRGR